MSLSEQIMSDMKDAMKAKDKVRLNTVRMIKAALMNEKIKTGHELSPDEELTVLNREKKQREESITDFTKANRKDLADETKEELAVVEGYLPKQLTQAELQNIAAETVAELDAKTPADFGAVMKKIMPKVKGRADGKAISAAVRNLLS